MTTKASPQAGRRTRSEASPRGRRARLGLVALALVILSALLFVGARRRDNPDAVWEIGEAELRAGRIDQAQAAVERLSRLREPTPLDWMLRAQVDIARGRADEGVAELAKVPDDHRMAAQARLLAGQVELRRHRARFAEQFLREAIRLDPSLVMAHRELISVLGYQHRRTELTAEFEALSRLTELTFENVLHWGLMRTVQWEPGTAIEELNQFVQADPQDRWARLALAENYRRMGLDEDAETAIAPLPDSDPEALAIRVLNAVDRHQDDKAEKLLNSGPVEHPALARIRGRQALARRDYVTAERILRVANADSPDNRETLFGLISALQMRGDDRAAAPLLEQAKNLELLNSLLQKASVLGARKNPSLLRELGAACAALGRDAEARAWYKLAIGQDPLDHDSQQALFRIKARLEARAPRSSTGEARPRN